MNGARTGLGRRIYERKQRWDATPATAGVHETSTQPENRDPSLAVAHTIVVRPLDGRRAQTRLKINES